MSKRTSSDSTKKGSQFSDYKDNWSSESGEEDEEINQSASKKLKPLSFGLSASKISDNKSADASKLKPIQMKFGAQKATVEKQQPKLKATSSTVAAVFNVDDDDSEEEMPPEARMRMRNIGRDTPTSAGPNSFGKTKQGFCDAKKVFEKALKKKMEEV